MTADIARDRLWWCKGFDVGTAANPLGRLIRARGRNALFQSEGFWRGAHVAQCRRDGSEGLADKLLNERVQQ